MPWCPACRTEYRDGFARCADCGAALTGQLPPEREEAQKVSVIPENEYPESWARSTLETSVPVEELAKVHESWEAERSWPHDVLDENGIPYRIEIKPYVRDSGWRVKAAYSQEIFVEEAHKDAAERLIREAEEAYKSEDALVPIEQDEDELVDSMDDPLPQITCPACGGDIDFDFAKCPLCDHRLQEL